MMADPIRILVADDDSTARLLMHAALRKAGFEVNLAVDGEDALRQFQADPCEMVMLDVEMPGLSGFQVCSSLRKAVGNELPIVMVTGAEDSASIEQAYESGATDFIAKPINWALIGHRVKYLLRASQAKRGLRTANARNAAVLDAIPDLLFELDLDGRYIEYHSPRSDLPAAPAESFIGKTVADILPPDAAEVCLSALSEAHQKGSSMGKQFVLQLPHGTFWFELSVSRKAADSGQKPPFHCSFARHSRRRSGKQNFQACLLRHLDRPAQPAAFSGKARAGVERAQRQGTKLAILSSTWTSSRASTTPWDTIPAT